MVKGTTLHSREGNDYPRMVRDPSGMLNAVGLQNKGVNYFIENIYPRIRRCGSEIIVNVSGASVDDYVAVAERLSDLEDIHAIGSTYPAPTSNRAAWHSAPHAPARRQSQRPCAAPGNRTLIVKLSPNVTDTQPR